MMQGAKALLWIGIVGALGAAAGVACGDDALEPSSVSDDTPAIAAVTLSPNSATIGVGESRELIASVVDENGDPVFVARVDWSSSDSAVANVQTGTFVSQVTGIGPGQATITATSGGESGQAAIEVVEP